MRRGDVAAGVVDSGLASLATFAAGLYAVRALPGGALGAYALAFAAFNLAAVLPAQLLFAPAEVAAVAFPRPDRAGLLGASLRAGAPAALLAALLAPAWALAAPAGTERDALVALALTAAACTALSPAQDHVRRMLHAAGRSWRAAWVSAVQLAAVAAAVLLTSRAGIGAAWVPLGALAAANLLSLAVGVAGSGWRAGGRPDALRARELAATGRWLLAAGAVGPASAFLAAAVVGALAGAGALGDAEAARIVGHPVMVLATGLSAVLGPRSMQAAREGRRDVARRVSARFQALTLGLGALYLAAAAVPWALNPLPALVPRAYAVPGLAALSIAANLANGGLFPGRAELLGLGRAAGLARADLEGSVLRVALAATAGTTRAFAVPLGFLALGAARWSGYGRLLGRAWTARRPAAVAAA